LAAIDGGKHDFTLLSGNQLASHHNSVNATAIHHAVIKRHMRSMLGWGVSHGGGMDGTPRVHGAERLLLVLAGARLSADKVMDAERGIAVPPATPSSRMERSLYSLLANSSVDSLYSADHHHQHLIDASLIRGTMGSVTPSHKPAPPMLSTLPSMPIPHTLATQMNGSRSARSLRDNKSIEALLPFTEDVSHDSNRDGALTTRSVDGSAKPAATLLTVLPALRKSASTTSALPSGDDELPRGHGKETVTQRNHRRRREKLQRQHELLNSSHSAPSISTMNHQHRTNTTHDGESDEVWRWKQRQEPSQETVTSSSASTAATVTESKTASEEEKHNDINQVDTVAMSSSNNGTCSTESLPMNDNNDRKGGCHETIEEARRRIVTAIRAAGAGVIHATIPDHTSGSRARIVVAHGNNTDRVVVHPLTSSTLPIHHDDSTTHPVKADRWWQRANGAWRTKQNHRRHAIKAALAHLKDTAANTHDVAPSSTPSLSSSSTKVPKRQPTLPMSSSTGAMLTSPRRHAHGIRKGSTAAVSHHSLPSLPSSHSLPRRHGAGIAIATRSIVSSISPSHNPSLLTPSFDMSLSATVLPM
jgi:hypothetical protein